MKSQNYSLSRMILALASGDKTTIESCPEIQLSRQELEPNKGRPARYFGAMLPGFRPRASGLSGTTQAAGGAAEQLTVSEQIALAVRAQSHVLELGARLLPAGVGGLAFPVSESGNASYWLAENSGVDAATTDAVFSQRTARPHALVTNCQYSRQLLGQARADLENFVLTDIGRAIAAEIDRAALNGSGTAGQPVGLLQVSAVPVVALGTNGANPTADNLAALEETIGLANLTPNGWLTTPSIRRRLRKTPSIASGYDPIWSDDAGGRVMGYLARTSTNVPSTLSKGTSNGNCHAIICGDWTQMIVSIWDHEVIVDPFQNKKTGLITVTVYTSIDLVVLRPSGFVLCLDALA